MKREIITIIIILLLVIVAYTKETTFYPETGKVVDITGEVVTVETATGNLFQFDGAEDWDVGDCVSMIMDGCGTEKVTDDIIIKATYSNWEVNNNGKCGNFKQ